MLYYSQFLQGGDTITKIDAIGDICPIPVVRAKKAFDDMDVGTLEILVDNETAVENLKRLASSLGCGFSHAAEDGGIHKVTLEKHSGSSALADTSAPVPAFGDTVVVISSATMGTGDDNLGKILMKSFIYALTQLDNLPDTVLLYNGGALLSVEGSNCLDDLRVLEQSGVTVMTCGACLNHYGMTDKLKAGFVTNMYSIVETMSKAGRILRP